MIPKNIKREHVIKAIEEIKRNGIPKSRNSRKFLLKFNGRYYPPKYVISLANKYANGEILGSTQFNGGKETNDFLRNLGFSIIEFSTTKKLKPFSTKREKKLSNIHHPRNVEKFKEFIERKRVKLTSWLVTVIPHFDEKRFNKSSNKERLSILINIVDYILNQIGGNGIILFPAGWFDAGHRKANSLYNWIERSVVNLLKNYNNRKIIISVGIDGREGKDQIAIALSKSGIKAIGRKFYPTNNEKGWIEIAPSYLSKENGKLRMFKLNDKKYFMCICYDIFGIKHKKLGNPGVDIVLNLIHEFRKGESEANFARHGLAGVSARWKCRVFASAKFFKPIPKKWPSAVYWNGSRTSSPSCTYSKISINPSKEFYLNIDDIKILLRIFKL